MCERCIIIIIIMSCGHLTRLYIVCPVCVFFLYTYLMQRSACDVFLKVAANPSFKSAHAINHRCFGHATKPYVVHTTSYTNTDTQRWCTCKHTGHCNLKFPLCRLTNSAWHYCIWCLCSFRDATTLGSAFGCLFVFVFSVTIRGGRPKREMPWRGQGVIIMEV